ncbi:hypothetical protein B2J88_04095 [Rhodococcus sp. SRB_17]|uniref:acyltransferase family protein n=1 Tax=Rhodococcus sp. OK302 TaxID=1882769 RepID=UPI000B940D17|nr:acyltransferase family protein [Rhodococcus sp. OK302]NMM83549.1 hypothetical protein [Rhodococcus sp. SRB_17]OYD71649.1 putative membrane protein YcfT [Rhodococcus sp. OK302]
MASAQNRVGWIDYARGLAIVLVVFHHSVIFLDAIDAGSASLTSADNLMVSVRMPLFFVAAGLFAGKHVTGTWAHLFARRIALFMWIYVLWSAIRFAVFSFVTWPLDSSEAGTAISLATSMILPSGALWFIYALALYYAVARLVSALPTAPIIVVAAAISILFSSSTITTGDYEWDSIFTYFVYFLVACRFRNLIVDATERGGFAALALTSGAFVAVSALAYIADAQEVPGVRTVASIVGVAATFILCKYLDALPGGRFAEYLGQNTMPIYLLHYFLLAFAVVYLDGPLSEFSPIVTSLALTVVVTLACVGIHRVTQRVPGLYTLPRRLVLQKTA